MDITNWCILAFMLLVSTNAGRYDQGPQYFYEPSSAAQQVVPNYKTKDILLYLTPSQVQALEADGAVLRPQESKKEQNMYPIETEQEEEEESEQSREQTENLDEQRRKKVLELEEIFRLLNENIENDAKGFHGDIYREQVSQTKPHEQEEGDEEEQVEELKRRGEQVDSNQDDKRFEIVRRIPTRFGALQRYRVEKYLSPSILQKQSQQHVNNFKRPPSHHRNPTRLHQDVNKKSEINREYGIKENKITFQDKYKIIPVEEVPQEENKQKVAVNLGQDRLMAYLNPLLSNNKVFQSIEQHQEQLLQHELQLYKGLQELKEAPRHSSKEYAIEIERLRANLEAQNALLMAEVIARANEFLPKEEINTKKNQHDNNDHESLSARPMNIALRGPQQFAFFDKSTPIPVPVIRRSRIEIKSPKTIMTEKRAPALPTNKVYVKIDNPYVERIIPMDIDKQIHIRKPEGSTIIRHLWEH